ncbi:CDIF630_02480 family spore surface protein [Anaeromicropila herbilytica]|uniref:DUF3787 domain-containing protein n=1 Tax=Anaeromicropila herbilytica TaxID=2785025 RepID=A0A7R7EH37_9FIRM|nr:DUF3787 domain-containing protein [Anaeromicropila herbilytica]BCN29110.1 hypothetical protein bsdtb5_04050 [Anaeromicropila herbilytica]
MKQGNFKSKAQKTPIEKHETAAWSNKAKHKASSNVNIPSDMQVMNAKEYVDDNEK